MSEQLEKERYLLFADCLGLEGWNGESFENEKKWLSYYAKQLKTCTSFYLIFSERKISTVFWSLAVWLGFYKKEVEAEIVMILFLKELKETLKIRNN